MKFHCIKHVDFEGPENVERWAAEQKHEFIITNAWQSHFPKNDSFDVLVLMGGPMSANDEKVLPWIKQEKKLIERAIESNKKIIGVCLGSQLIASVLGAKVYKNQEKEIGWYPVKLTGDGLSHKLLRNFPGTFEVFHWHGETFDLPEGALHLLKSDACLNQAFVYDDRILGLQFHMEGTKESTIRMMENSLDEMTSGKFVSDEATIRRQTDDLINQTGGLFRQIMDRFI